MAFKNFTLGDFDNDLDRLIKRFVEKLKVLLEWCYYNKLDINWSKTFFMFVTNRRVKLPKEMALGRSLLFYYFTIILFG